MRLFLFVLSLVIAIASSAFAQARRIPPRNVPSSIPVETSSNANSDTVSSASVMYEEAKNYTKRKFEEFKTRKTPYSDELREQTLREQKQLAARYALQLGAGKNLDGENLYYLGMLNIIATNDVAAAEAFKKYLTGNELNQEKAQTARSFLAVTAARQKDFIVAENALAEYLKSAPIKVRERLAVERELAKQYQTARNFDKAIVHGENALTAARAALRDAATDELLLEVISELGETLYDIYWDAKANDKAFATLELLREAAIAAQSANLYLDATDRMIVFLIEQKRKSEALEKLKTEQDAITINFRDLGTRARVKQYFQNRDKQYRLLGEVAPEIAIDRWINEKGALETAPVTLASMKGKVVLIDFWATWCKPCFDAFPELSEWHQTYSKDGLQIIGLTRYYGQAGGFSADEVSELAFLQKFKREQRLPYPFAVAKSAENHRAYFSFGLPTVVLIDKKGAVRFVETGTNMTNEELEKLIQKLLAE